MQNEDELLTTRQAAERLGKSPNWILKLVIAGRLPAVRPGRDYLVRASDLGLVADLKPGRPPRKETSSNEG